MNQQVWIPKVAMTIPLGMTREPFTKIAISVPDLVKQTNSFSVSHRPGCNATLLDSSPKDLFLHYNVKCHESYSDPNGHDVYVHFDVSKIAQTGNANDLDVKVQCSCPAFLYWGAQWNLHQRDGLEPPSRPELRAPTQRLDLRSHFVICKHCKAVFERILPAVQHNINNLLRKTDVERRTKELEKEWKEHPEKKPTIRRRVRPEIEKIRKEKNKEVKQEMLDALLKEEEERLKHKHELEHEDKGTTHTVERGEPATAPARKPRPEWEKLPVHYQPSAEEKAVLDALQKEEEERLHEEHKPHLHHGVPEEVTKEISNKDLQEQGKKRMDKLRKRRGEK